MDLKRKLARIIVAGAGLSAIFCGTQAQADGAIRERPWVLAAKPSAIFLATGGGLEIGREMTTSGILSLNAEIDHYLVGGTGFLGAAWRESFWGHLYLQGGLGITEVFFHSYNRRSPGAYAVAGWEFNTQGGYQPGIDFGGYHFAFDEEGEVVTPPAFPKLRLSIKL